MKVVFDVDDTLWGLCKKVYSDLGIDINLMDSFMVAECERLTDDEKKRIIEAFQNPDTFKNIKWYEGVEEINQLSELGIEAWIKSNNFGIDVRDTKAKELAEVLTIPSERIILNLVTASEIQSDKGIDKDVDVFVDDNPRNLASSKAKINIAIKAPWNTSDSARIILKDKHIIYCSTFMDAIGVIKHMAKLEKDFSV